MQSFFVLFFMGIKVAFLIPPSHTFVTHDETNQAKCNKSSNEQTETNCAMCIYHIRQIKLCAANWTDICNKLSNKTNHVMCNK